MSTKVHIFLTNEDKDELNERIFAIEENGSYTLTEEDKAEIVEEVINALPNLDEVNY